MPALRALDASYDAAAVHRSGWIRIGQARTDSLAHGGPAYDSLQTLVRGGVPSCIVSPLEVLVRGADPAGNAAAVVSAAQRVPGVASALRRTLRVAARRHPYGRRDPVGRNGRQ